jgi:GTP-binding protein EngB required for normal cell division
MTKKEKERRILLLAANPQCTHPLRLDKEISAIQNGLSRSKNREIFTFSQKWAVNPIDLQRAILDFNPHIVHFSGHGAGEDGLILESNDKSGAHFVSTEALASLFSLFKEHVECVVLNACYSEIQAEAINCHIDYVVGMHQEIGDAAAIAFSIGFYDALWAGRNIQFAYKLGCTAIQLNSPQQQPYSQHLTPILKIKPGAFIQNSDSIVDTANSSEITEAEIQTLESPSTSEEPALSPYMVPFDREASQGRDCSNPQIDLGDNFLSSEGQMRSGRLRPQYTTQDLTQEFTAGLEDFSDWLETDKIRNALGRDLIRQLRCQERGIYNRLQDKFSIVVVGDFKRGKSTLINALIGTPIVSTSVTTETVCINEIEYGDLLRVKAYLKDGRAIEINPEQLPSNCLQPILNELNEPVSHLLIQAPIDWLKGFRIVDTPGTGDMMQRFDKQVHSYLSKADVLLYVMFSAAVLSESERAFLTSSVIPQDFPKIFFIINRLDELNEEDEKRLLKRTKQRISELFPNAYTFGISALDEFSRIQGSHRPNPERANKLAQYFQDLRAHLHDFALLHKEIIQLDRATDLMDQMLLSFETHTSIVKNAMQSDRHSLEQAVIDCKNNTAQLHQKLEQHNQDIHRYIISLRNETISWMNEFILRLEEEAIPEIQKFELQDIQKHYQFFLSDVLRQAVNVCIDSQSTQIANKIEGTLKQISEDFNTLIHGDIFNLNVAQATLTSTPWTNLNTFKLIMDFSGKSGLFEVANLLLSKAKELEKPHATYQYAAQLKANLYTLREAVESEVILLYDRIYKRIEVAINESYQQAIESSKFALQQAQAHMNQDQQHVLTTKEGLTEALSLLTDSRTFLQSFKKKLWTDAG